MNYPVLDYRKSWEEAVAHLAPKPAYVTRRKRESNAGAWILVAILIYVFHEPLAAFLSALGR